MWAIPDDVRARWLGPDPLTASDTQLQTLIDDAEDTIRAEFPNIQARIDDGDLPSERVVKVVCRVVLRVVRNPQGLRQVQDGAGPYQVSRTYGGDEPGEIYLSDEDRAELAPARLRAFSIDTTPSEASP